MSAVENDYLCPFCLSDNQCGVNAIEACWCREKNIPQGLLDLLPLASKQKHCICMSCINAYNKDMSLFEVRRLSH
tara:strand:- start:595 stop:819 length:225 start_codon:yes stop_codon:yes gene_type:complete